MRIYVARDPKLVFERLEDGTSIVFDPATDSTHALNRSATRVWSALVEGGDDIRVRSVLEDELGPGIRDEAVHNTLAQFQAAGLIRTDGDPRLAANLSRRDTLRRMSIGFAAAMAFPLIETLTGNEQRAHANSAITPVPTTPPPTTPPPTTTIIRTTAPPTTPPPQTTPSIP